MALIKECDIEKFAQENLNFSKGIFRKKSSVRDMLSWTGEAITKPMLSLARDKAGKKMAIEQFKLVQIYMGDRKARVGMSLNSVAMDIILQGVANPGLRDELYVQLCRQTTENPKRESLIRGWELMAICLSFVPPSPTFQPALLGYMNRHRDPSFAKTFPEIGKWPIHVQVSHYATIACRRLERIGSSGKKQAKKSTEDEINHSRVSFLEWKKVLNWRLLFSCRSKSSAIACLATRLSKSWSYNVKSFQRERSPGYSTRFRNKYCWCRENRRRVYSECQRMSMKSCVWRPMSINGNSQKTRERWVSFLSCHADTFITCLFTDAHAPASLLKLWYRELYDPLIPDEFYEECVQTDDPKEVMAIIDRIPPINRLVRFLLWKLGQLLIFFAILGANIPDPLPPRILTPRSCGLHEDGFFQFSNGLRSEFITLHFEWSEDHLRKYSQGDEFHPSANHLNGHFFGCVRNINRWILKLVWDNKVTFSSPSGPSKIMETSKLNLNFLNRETPKNYNFDFH